MGLEKGDWDGGGFEGPACHLGKALGGMVRLVRLPYGIGEPLRFLNLLLRL
jgi:hypothetical protein